jgi:hypothetical protein
MIVFSTVLEIEGQPTLYSVYKNKSLAFLNPATAKAPIIFATYQDSDWMIRGTNDHQIKQQVVNEMKTVD